MFRRFAEWLNRRTDGEVEAESREWSLVCPACGFSQDVWKAGGVRYRATSVGKRVLGRCPSCRYLGFFRVERSGPGDEH